MPADHLAEYEALRDRLRAHEKKCSTIGGAGHAECLDAIDALLAERTDLLAQVRALTRERDEARGNLASIADATNTWLRETSLTEINDYLSLSDMRDGVDRIALRSARLRTERDEARAELARLRAAVEKIVEAFDEYADHGLQDDGRPCAKHRPGATIPKPCTCGFKAAQEQCRAALSQARSADLPGAAQHTDPSPGPADTEPRKQP